MCRLLGIAAERATDFRRCLVDAPRSLATLSREHPDGWGVAVWTMSLGWRVKRSVRCAGEDDEFDRAVRFARGRTLVAHVRRRTVGETSLANTHPFVSGKWTFAHNGTIDALERFRGALSPARTSAVRGETDSELLFAHLLDHVEGVGAKATRAAVDAAVLRAVSSLESYGSTTFLLSDGVVIYGWRSGRSLSSLVRNGSAVLFASEPITDEPWQDVPEHTLVRVTHAPGLGVHRF